MKFYITVEGIQKLKRSFLNLKLYSVISVPEVLFDLGFTYNEMNDYKAFIVHQKLESLINNYVKSKRIRGIIYSNPNISSIIIENLFDELEKNERISDLVLLDDYNIPKLQEYYEYFQEIIFFPSVKKIRLIECKEIKNKNIPWKV
ncbi:MAG: hypothetical protein PHF86_02385 [Candidatus Nanoarchaeia archaeon]|nr:hypothetical protein [Candidatus Nanoarchaeia archaeon]